MATDFVNIGSFDNYISAHIALGKLQERYINCHLLDEHTVTIDPILTYAIGGIKLMVVRSQAERAIEILNENEDSSSAAENDVNFPAN
jgi:hypothetical protein